MMKYKTTMAFIVNFVIVLTAIATTTPTAARSNLIRSIWNCDIPCVVQRTGESLAPVQLTYCSTSTLSTAMIKTLDPVCRIKTGRADAVAARASPAKIATCISSSNPCVKEGLVRAGFTCSLMCPAEDNVSRKFTTCATTADEAWLSAVEICKDAVPPGPSYLSPSKVCFADGQTPCE